MSAFAPSSRLTPHATRTIMPTILVYGKINMDVVGDDLRPRDSRTCNSTHASAHRRARRAPYHSHSTRAADASRAPRSVDPTADGSVVPQTPSRRSSLLSPVHPPPPDDGGLRSRWSASTQTQQPTSPAPSGDGEGSGAAPRQRELSDAKRPSSRRYGRIFERTPPGLLFQPPPSPRFSPLPTPPSRPQRNPFLRELAPSSAGRAGPSSPWKGKGRQVYVEGFEGSFAKVDKSEELPTPPDSPRDLSARVDDCIAATAFLCDVFTPCDVGIASVVATSCVSLNSSLHAIKTILRDTARHESSLPAGGGTSESYHSWSTRHAEILSSLERNLGNYYNLAAHYAEHPPRVTRLDGFTTMLEECARKFADIAGKLDMSLAQLRRVLLRARYRREHRRAVECLADERRRRSVFNQAFAVYTERLRELKRQLRDVTAGVQNTPRRG